MDEYRSKLSQLTNWIPFLLKNSGLPGPRGNLELAQVVGELADKEQVEALLSIPAEKAPENSPQVFLVFCGISALGKMAARGDRRQMRRLRAFASDARWRVREAVATALQYVGDADMPRLFNEMDRWSTGNWYEKRAAAAALAEPRLLGEPSITRDVLRIFDDITATMASAERKGDDSFKVLRQAMGYCWSVAVAALPSEGKPLMEKWLLSTDRDIQWIMRENLKKSRLRRMDARWVDAWRNRLQTK